jgi:CDP-diacylglycerol---serine O-phosphatidyltransferase
MQQDEAGSEQAHAERRSRRGIYLLPNLFTTAALFSGFYAVIAATADRFEAASVAIFIAMLLDSLDGRVARLTHTESAFGAQYDSLSDLVSFGVAPALVMYEWSLVYMKTSGWAWGKLGWLAAFFYATAAALRLARFNIKLGTADKRFFLGLPSPAAAALMAGSVWVWNDLGYTGAELKYFAVPLTLAAGALMVSNFAYYSFKDIDLRGKVPFVVFLAILLAFIFASIDPPKILFAAFLIYAASGPCIALLRWRRKRLARANHLSPPI